MDPARIRSLRQRYRLTQYEFAAVLGVQQASVSYWETGVRFPTEPYVALMEQMEYRLDQEDAERRRTEAREKLITAGTLGLGALMLYLFSNDNNDDDE